MHQRNFTDGEKRLLIMVLMCQAREERHQPISPQVQHLLVDSTHEDVLDQLQEDIDKAEVRASFLEMAAQMVQQDQIIISSNLIIPELR